MSLTNKKRFPLIAPLIVASLTLGITGAGCGAPRPSPGAPVQHAVDSRVDWAPAEVTSSVDDRGRPVDEIKVRGGEVVRLTVDDGATGPIEIGERVRSGAGHAESWSHFTAKDSAIVVRATLLGTAILVPKGTTLRAHIARATDPGYAWFELEGHILTWAEGPLPAPFPKVAPPERIDYPALASLDAVLAKAVNEAKDKDAAIAGAHAIRRIVGLRAIRALRPPAGFPYFYDDFLEPDGAEGRKTAKHMGLKSWLVTPVDPLTVTVEGPRILQVWSFGVQGDDDETISLRVTEGGRERARSGGSVLHARTARSDAPMVPVEQAETMSLRRAVVHVPPGKHVYSIETKGGQAFVAATRSKPVVHVGDAMSGVKSESSQLATAHEACASSATICAITKALAGEDVAPDWAQWIAALDKESLAVTQSLAAGGPHDPMLDLELAASMGDELAIQKLGDATLRLVDDGVRAAWLRGTARGTRWVVSQPQPTAEEGGERWLSLLFDKLESAGCATASDAPWTELTAEGATYESSIFRGAKTIELMAAVSCEGAKAPVKLEIDGETLAANPSSALVKWHVLVKGSSARVARKDSGDGHVYAIKPDAAQCGAHWGFIGAPKLASTSPTLAFDKKATAPGLEVWIREGSKSSSVDVVSTVDPKKRVTLVVTPRSGFVAVDHAGHRWIRVARMGLPLWASEGAQAIGKDDVAVRAIVRTVKGEADGSKEVFTSPTAEAEAPPREAIALDESKLIALSRQILGAQADAKGKKYLERAMMLAEGGEARAAIEDAKAAKVLGVKGPKGEDPIAFVRTAIRLKPRKGLELPAGTKAYGLEPDFDPGAPRCGLGSGPRAKLASVLDELKTHKTAKDATWDPVLAIRAVEAASLNSVDPRSPGLISRSMAGSRWQVPKGIAEGFSKVQRPHESQKEGAVDPDGDLRARIGTGQPFDRASYATITETRPAKAGLTGTGKAKAHVEWACVARSPADVVTSGAICPLVITVGDKPGVTIEPKTGPDGRGKVALPPLPPKGASTYVSIGLKAAPGRWAAIARVVFDEEVPGTTKVEGVGYVLMPPGLQWRFLVKKDQELTHTLAGPGLVRVDAVAEAEESPKVVVIVDGPDGPKETPVTLGGEPTIVAVPKGGVVRVKSTGGTSTIAIAERVAKGNTPEISAVEEAEAEPAKAEAADDVEPKATTSTALLDAGDPNALWSDSVSKSDKPLTPLQEMLGTVTTRSLGRYGTLRDGDPRRDFADGYFEQAVGYRRRIESIGLWAGIAGLGRARNGHESWGANAFFWGHINPLRLRVGGYADIHGQQIDGQQARTFQPDVYAEFSGKISPSFYLLPRAGYSGFYTSFDGRPVSLTGVDDDVYNGFRANRPTLLYGQVMAWFVPFFNDILFLRARANWNPLAGELSHAGLRPGTILAFGNLDLGVYADATWFRATEGIRAESKVDVTGVTYALYNLWVRDGSLDVQPGIGGRARAGDGGWEVYALVNVFASFRRGLRDFASPELAFPEQFGGNVPWRGPAVGGTR